MTQSTMKGRIPAPAASNSVLYNVLRRCLLATISFSCCVPDVCVSYFDFLLLLLLFEGRWKKDIFTFVLFFLSLNTIIMPSRNLPVT